VESIFPRSFPIYFHDISMICRLYPLYIPIQSHIEIIEATMYPSMVWLAGARRILERLFAMKTLGMSVRNDCNILEWALFWRNDDFAEIFFISKLGVVDFVVATSPGLFRDYYHILSLIWTSICVPSDHEFSYYHFIGSIATCDTVCLNIINPRNELVKC
jgi:hypothetical protein